MRIAVTGATGTVGGRVVRRLAATGDHELSALTRRPADFGPDVSRVHADYDDPASLRAALRGVDTLVFVSGDGEAARMLLQHGNVVTAAVDNAVGHVVYLSGVDATADSPFCYAFTNGHTENLLTASGLGFSFARAAIFTEFFCGLTARATDELRLPQSDARVSLVSRTDVADCLAALALAPASGRHHDLTGPRALDLAAIAETLAAHRGTRLRPVDITPADFATELADAGEDPWWAYAYASMFASIRQHRWQTVTDEVHRLTGREPANLSTVLNRLG